MKLKRILILGSSHLTQLVVDRLHEERGVELVGYVPSKRPTFPGKLWPLKQVEIEDVTYDIALSIQYDRKIPSPDRIFNLHTGLLPEYGGLDILRHTINENAKEQGLTFHKMVDEYDAGPIISKVSYPVLPSDGIMDLYKKQAIIAPGFVTGCLHLLKRMTWEEVDQCAAYEPRLLKRTGEKLGKNDTPF